MKISEEVNGYWDLRSRGFSESVKNEWAESGFIPVNEIIGRLQAPEGSSFLDLGCGPGYYSVALADMGFDVTGIDYSEEMLSQARKNASEHNVTPEFIRADASFLPFEDGSFDFIVSRNVIWNLPEPKKAYSEILRVLRSGGKAFITDGNFYNYLFDEEYAELHRKLQAVREGGQGGHMKFNCGDVDFSIMEELARSLPLSKERRPFWDIRTLTDLGCNSIDIRYPSGPQAFGSDESRLVMGFEIIFRK